MEGSGPAVLRMNLMRKLRDLRRGKPGGYRRTECLRSEILRLAFSNRDVRNGGLQGLPEGK